MVGAKLEAQVWMSRGDQIVVDVAVTRADMARHTRSGAAGQTLCIALAAQLLLANGETSPCRLVVLGQPVLGRSMATLATDTKCRAVVRMVASIVPALMNVAIQTETILMGWFSPKGLGDCPGSVIEKYLVRF